ncbi:interferon-induced protein 44-like [Chaetodon auriga]|uniref:interferon-induced protein 44-like n=1 Tax=Chaetodon auriga TaxID=39042 RepID=UPI0040330315
MGDDQSKSQPPPPPPSPFFSEPWRKINWRDNQSALQYVKEYRPQNENQQLRILLHGPPGAGKSSFINSVQSVLHGRMYTQALVAHTFHGILTKKYTTYKIQKERSDTFYPFVFNDTMGLSEDKGVHVEDVKLALKGHVMEGYRFNPQSRLSEDDRFYNKSPTANDKVHVLVCVIDANKLSMKEEVLQKIKDIRKEASDLGIPQVVIFTKPDELSPEIKESLKNVYKVKILKKKLETFSADVGIPMNCIFPVKNYHEEIDIDSDVDSLILSALRNIINFGEPQLQTKC